LPLEIKPAKGGMSTLYLRIPKDVMKMYNINQDRQFIFELLNHKEEIKLTYRLQAPDGKRKEKEKE